MKSAAVFVGGLVLSSLYLKGVASSSAHVSGPQALLYGFVAFSAPYYVSFLVLGKEDTRTGAEVAVLLILSLSSLSLLFIFNPEAIWFAVVSSIWLSIMAISGWITGRVMARKKEKAL